MRIKFLHHPTSLDAESIVSPFFFYQQDYLVYIH